MEDFKYLVKIYTNQKLVEWKTNDLSPSNIEDKVDLDQFDGDFVTKGEAIDLETGKLSLLSDDGYWNFIPVEK